MDDRDEVSTRTYFTAMLISSWTSTTLISVCYSLHLKLNSVLRLYRILPYKGKVVVKLVMAQRYERRFDSRWGLLRFFIDVIPLAAQWPWGRLGF